jgi:5-methylcytosine-specific restriction endonuclease McrA
MTGRSWQQGSTRAWRRIRAAVLERDGYRCRLRITEVCSGVATHVHHTRGRALTGDDPRWLVAACQPCNLHVGDVTRPAVADPAPTPRTRW